MIQCDHQPFPIEWSGNDNDDEEEEEEEKKDYNRLQSQTITNFTNVHFDIVLGFRILFSILLFAFRASKKLDRTNGLVFIFGPQIFLFSLVSIRLFLNRFQTIIH